MTSYTPPTHQLISHDDAVATAMEDAINRYLLLHWFQEMVDSFDLKGALEESFSKRYGQEFQEDFTKDIGSALIPPEYLLVFHPIRPLQAPAGELKLYIDKMRSPDASRKSIGAGTGCQDSRAQDWLWLRSGLAKTGRRIDQ